MWFLSSPLQVVGDLLRQIEDDEDVILGQLAHHGRHTVREEELPEDRAVAAAREAAPRLIGEDGVHHEGADRQRAALRQRPVGSDRPPNSHRYRNSDPRPRAHAR